MFSVVKWICHFLRCLLHVNSTEWGKGIDFPLPGLCKHQADYIDWVTSNPTDVCEGQSYREGKDALGTKLNVGAVHQSH